jgi:hypothetical protein
MSRKVTAAPTNEMAIGRKITDLATDSPRCSRSARVANTRPITRARAGTTTIHSAVFRSDRTMDGSVNTNSKLSKPTQSLPRRSRKDSRIVLITG